ncbi:MAG: recombinase RecT [Thermomicrobiales bacterium]|nr:recombinase RecT [Thermomicrobiales bacterium]
MSAAEQGNAQLAVIEGRGAAAAMARPVELLPPSMAWLQMREMATEIHRSGLMPAGVTNAAATLAIMLKGRELGIPAMTAIEGIAIIKGKPSLGAHLMLALIKRDCGSQAIRVAESTPDHCTIEYRETGWPGVQRYTYTIEMARTAGLTGSDNWKKYPDAMLRTRCISAVAKMAFPQVVGAMYSPDELGVPVTVTEDGSVVIDYETGEIVGGASETNDPPSPDSTPRREPPASQPARRIPNAPPPEPQPVNQRALAALHAAVAEAAQRDGDGLRGNEPHACAHDLAAAKYGVDSLRDLAPEQMRELIEAVGRMDAADLMGAWQWAKARLARAAEPTQSEPLDAEFVAMDGPDGEPGNDAWTN